LKTWGGGGLVVKQRVALDKIIFGNPVLVHSCSVNPEREAFLKRVFSNYNREARKFEIKKRIEKLKKKIRRSVKKMLGKSGTAVIKNLVRKILRRK